MTQIKTVNGSAMIYKLWFDGGNMLKVQFRKVDKFVYIYTGVSADVVENIRVSISPGKMFRASVLNDATITVIKQPL